MQTYYEPRKKGQEEGSNGQDEPLTGLERQGASLSDSQPSVRPCCLPSCFCCAYGSEALSKVRTSRWRRDARMSPCRSRPASDYSSFLRESFRLVYTRVFLYALIRDSIGVPRWAFPQGGHATLDHTTTWTRTWFPKKGIRNPDQPIQREGSLDSPVIATHLQRVSTDGDAKTAQRAYGSLRRKESPRESRKDLQRCGAKSISPSSTRPDGRLGFFICCPSLTTLNIASGARSNRAK